jgi:hypothetical protein
MSWNLLFWKSKLKRSFEYATILLEIGTPPYFENFNMVWASYYVAEHLETNTTFRKYRNPRLSDNENILRQFTKFTFILKDLIWSFYVIEDL